nr:hypothetical protein [Tanacetum cinerariifolium]
MATTIEQQVAMDEALVPSIQRLMIERSNFRLPSDIQSKESTMQVLYDVLRRCPFFKVFLVTADVPEIYIQEFWATANVHHHAIRFKMDNKKHIVNLESFRDMLHICPRIPGQSFDELPFEEEILDFFRFLGHSAQIRTLTDVNINKLFQSWGYFAAVINKCLTGKSSSIDNFVYQVEHKNHKKSNEMYYPRFTKVIIHHFMSKDLSIPRRNKVNRHYVRDDFIFSTIKVVSRHQNTQQYGAMLPIELTNKEIMNTKAYKEYYAYATGEAAPKPKASARRKRSGSDSSITPPTAVATPRPTIAATPKLTVVAKGKQPAKQPKPKNSSDDEDADAQEKYEDDDEGDERDESNDGEEDDDNDKDGVEKDDDDDDDEESESDEESDGEETKEKESFNPIPRTPEESEDDGNDEEDQGLKDGEEERLNEEEEAGELYRDVDINQGKGLQLSQDIEDSHVTLTLVNPDGQQESSSVSSQFVTSMLNPTSDAGVESIFATASTSVAPLPTPTPTMTPSIIATITTASQAPIPPTPILSEVLQNLPTFDSVFRFDDRLKSLEASFFEYRQTNPFAEAVSNIPGIVHQYMNQQMNEAVRVAVQIQTDRLRDSYQRENDEFLRTIDDNMKRIIKEQVKGQVKEQVSKILPRIEQSVNAQLEAEVLTRSSHSSRTSYAIAADLSEMELEKILIEKMEGNKRDDESDKDEGPSAGSDRGSKRRREGKEPESASTPLETATRSAGRSTTGSKSRQASASESAFAEEPMQTTSQIEEPSHPVFKTGVEDQPIVQSSQHPEWFSQPKKPPTPDRDWNKTLPVVQGSTQTWISELAKQADTRSSFNELLDTPLDFSNFIINRLRVDTLTPELLAGPTYELMKGSCTSLIELEYHLEEVYKATQINWIGSTLKGGASSRKYTTSVTKTNAADYGNIKWIEDLGRKRQQFYGFAVNRKSALDVYSKRKIIAVTDLKIVEWHSYKHLDWISDVHKKHRHPATCGRSSTGSRKLPEEAQPYQARYVPIRSKRRETYTAYSNPRGFIYQNKDKKNRLMRVDELYKFSDETLNDVRTTLDDRLKGIRMQYLPQTIWRKGDKDRAAAMIQAIDKMLKTRRIMRSLEKFVGGRLYEGDFRMLQRTI